MTTPELHNSRFLKAARLEPTDTTPIWIMRQAGRYMPEYMAVRNKVTFIELCKTPELAAEVTLTAQQILGVDAAILFADLLPLLEPMGIDLEYIKGKGPVIHNPLRTVAEVDAIKPITNFDDMGFVYDTVKLVREGLPADIPLIGFAGLPFTLASYCIEGGGSKNYVNAKSMMYNEPSAWHGLMQKLVESVSGYLQRQIEAGCQAVQLFDSWAGCLGPADYRQYALPYNKAIFDSLPGGVPVVNFLTGNPALLPLQREAGGTVMGVDWRIDLGAAWDIFGDDVAVQGNLDPVSLYANLPTLKERAKAVIDSTGGRNGHIFNLGHGVMPDMNPDNVRALVQMVHELGTR
ncbi:uroporphyrinogen decarboxylase [bacterium]|nr:uroporphyrinogen decarboxylase [bacterium]